MSRREPSESTLAADLPPSYEAGRKLRFGLAVSLGILSAAVLLVLVNYLAARHLRWRCDLTSADRFLLSPLTRQVLPLVTNQVDVTVLFDRESTLFGHVDGLLKQYALEQPRIRVAVVDPVTQREAAFNLRVRYKLGAEVENVVIFDNSVHPPIVVSEGELSVYDADVNQMMAGSTKEIRRAGFRGELRFTTALNALLEAAPARVAFLSGHNERAIEDTSRSSLRDFYNLVATKNAIVETLRLDGTNSIPENLQLLVIAGGNKAYTESETLKVERYLNAGGRILWLLDPGAVQLVLGPEGALQAWGIGLARSFAGDPANSQASLDVLTRTFGSHPITAPLKRNQSRVLIPYPRVVGRLPSDRLAVDAPKVEVLISTSTNGLTKSDFTGGIMAFRPGVDVRGEEVPMAVAAEKGGVAGVTAGRQNARVVVIGDVNMFSNEWLRTYANYQFAELTAAWLLDRAQLLAIGPKPIAEYRLELSERQRVVLRWMLLAAMPGAVLGVGVLVWMRRRS